MKETIEIKCWREDKNIPLPVYMHDGDAGCDLYAKEIEYDSSKDRWIVHTGLHVEVPYEYELEARPRSNLTKYNFYIPNSPGTIDYGYRNEILVIFKCRTDKNILNILNLFGTILSDITRNNVEYYNSIVYAHSLYKDVIEQCDFPYKNRERIAQLIIRKRPEIIWKEVETLEDLGDSERGMGGHGSTGNK